MTARAGRAGAGWPRARARTPRATRAGALLGFGCLALLPLAAAACGGGERAGTRPEAPRARPEADVPEAARFGGIIVAAGPNDLGTLNGLVTTDVESLEHAIYLLDPTLVKSDAELEPVPYLARSWEWDPDAGTFTFHLRTDMRWQDGAPVTATDVAFTLARARDPDVPFPNPAYFDGWEAAEVLNDSTVRFAVIPGSWPLFGWTRTPILPEHLLGSVPAAELASHEFGGSPVGAGPFVFERRDAGDRWIFRANDDFPPELGGRPYADRYVYRWIPDETTLAAALRAGEVDVAVDVTGPTARRLAADSDLVVSQVPMAEYAILAWNPRRPFFSDPDVRKALTMAIDRRALVETVLAGYGEVASGPVGRWHWAYDTAWRPLPYAPDSARALLARAGWRDTDGDGILDRNGVPFRFDLLHVPRDDWRDVAAIVQANLAEVGVDVRPRAREQAALVPIVTSPDRRFDAFLVALSRDVPLDDRDLWACERIANPFQFAGYCRPELDAVLDSMVTVSDRERLKALVRRYHETIAADQPYTFLYTADRLAVRRRALHGTAMDTRGIWVNVHDWWLEPGARRRGP